MAARDAAAMMTGDPLAPNVFDGWPDRDAAPAASAVPTRAPMGQEAAAVDNPGEERPVLPVGEAIVRLVIFSIPRRVNMAA